MSIILKKEVRSEQGQALSLVLIALAVGTLLVLPFLGQANTALLTSRSYGQAMIEQYSAGGGVEHAIWRLKYETGFAGSLTAQNPTVNYPITINNMSVSITVSSALVEPPPQPPLSGGAQSDRVQLAKSVEPNVAPVSQNTTFTYTISIKNNDTSTIHFDEIADLLPPGFSYMSGSSNIGGNLDTRDPSIIMEGGQMKLRWGTQPPRPSVGAGQIGTQVFQGWAVLDNNVYWNNVSVQWTPQAVSTVSTGSTAPVGGLSPYVYDIISEARGTTIHARLRISVTGASISFWEVEQG